jgi:hypothetical protein
VSDENSSGIKIRRLFAEGVMVVASILVAFALDAWWEERQLEQEIREDLAIVEAELTENMRLIDQMLEMMERVTDAGTALSKAMLADSGGESISVPGRLIYWGVFINPTLDPSLGAIDAWIATGRMGGLANPELRKRLASVRGKVNDVTEEQIVARDLGILNFYPALSESLDDLRPVAEVFQAGFTQRQKIGVNEIPEIEYLTIPNNKELRLVIQARTLWYLASVSEMKDFRDELEEIREMLQEELGG